MSLYTNEILSSLGWALIHSVWQGGIACAFVMVLRSVWRADNPSARYLVQCGVLLSSFLAFIATFWIYLQKPASRVIENISVTASAPVESITINAASAGFAENMQNIASSSLNLGFLLPVIGLLWCLGFVLMSLRYAGGLYVIHTLRRKGLSPAPAQWRAAFEMLVEGLNISRDVKLFISNRIKSPITLGVVKPIVLVPVGFLTALPQDQVEAILLHELAHIRRYDYAFNLVQNAIKAVFFYHPAIHYISRCIDTDREQACDDLAVAKSTGPSALIRALAALPDTLQNPKLALAATGTRHTPILDRMTRLVDPKRKKSTPNASGILAMALVLTGAAYFSASSQANTANTPQDSDVSDTRLAGDVPQPPYAPPPANSGSNAPQLPAAPLFSDCTEDHSIDHATFGQRQGEISSTWAIFRLDMARFYGEFGQFAAKNPSWDGRVEMLRNAAEALEEKASDDFETCIENTTENYHDYLEDQQDQREDERERYEDMAEARAEAALERRADARRTAAEARENAIVARANARAQSREANKTKTKYDNLRADLSRQLKSDGYWNSSRKTQKIEHSNGIWTVNGKPLVSDRAKAYQRILSSVGIDKNKFVFAEIKNDGLHISTQSRQNGNNQTRDITIGTFDHSDSRSSHSPTRITVTSPEPPIPPTHTSHKTHGSESPNSHSHGPLPFYATPSGAKITPQFMAPLSRLQVLAGHNQFIETQGKRHSGVDYKAAAGTPVKASLDGTVIYAQKSGAWGMLMKIEHEGGMITKYASLGSFALQTGDSVKAGQIIGTVGEIDDEWGPHLHFEIHHRGHTYDPVYVLSQMQ